MSFEKEITVILTVWKRNHLEEQIEALLKQSKPPFEIWVQQTQNHVDVNDVIEKYREKIQYFCYQENKGVFGRFESVADVRTEYVFIIDDDIIPGVQFLEIALHKSFELNAIISPNGRHINPINNTDGEYIGDGYFFGYSFCKKDTLVDFGNNAWFFKTEWLDFFLQYPPMYRNNGEDIQLSASLKLKKNIDTYVPKQLIPFKSGNIKQYYSFDEHALHKLHDFQSERDNVIQRFRNEGWKLQKETPQLLKNSTLISIVMFCYEVSDNTLNTIQSIRNQSFTDFEYFIINNDVNKEFAKIISDIGDKRIRLIDTKEYLDRYIGLSIGCGVASGKYICFMSDDYTAVSNKLKIQYDYMECNPDIIASGSSCKFLSNNKTFNNELTSDESILSLVYENIFIEESLIIRNEILEKMAYFKPLQGLDMFYAMMIRLALCGNISNLPKCLVETRYNKQRNRGATIPSFYQKQLLSYFEQTKSGENPTLINNILGRLKKRKLISF